MRAGPPTLRRILASALAAVLIGLGTVSLITAFSDARAIRLLQAVAVFGAGAIVLGAAAVLVMVRLAGWRDPESDGEFDAIVERAERLAAEASWQDSFEPGGERADLEREEQDFDALVRSALDELPLEFHRALEHVAVVVSDGGHHRNAYGLYQGDTVRRDHFHDRIVIFRDTLRRDFGHDPEMLKAQVARTVRHELAHHLGWDEKGVRGLGL